MLPSTNPLRRENVAFWTLSFYVEALMEVKIRTVCGEPFLQIQIRTCSARLTLGLCAAHMPWLVDAEEGLVSVCVAKFTQSHNLNRQGWPVWFQVIIPPLCMLHLSVAIKKKANDPVLLVQQPLQARTHPALRPTGSSDSAAMLNGEEEGLVPKPAFSHVTLRLKLYSPRRHKCRLT